MDRLHYAGTSILTGTAIAQALLDYAQALAEARSSATLIVPTRNDDGSAGRSELLLGPSSQLISDREDSEYDEVTDPGLVARITAEAVRLRRYGPQSPAAEVSTGEHRDWVEEF